MRKVLVLVTLPLLACDGGTSNPADAGVDMVTEPPPDAPPSIDGTWRDTFHTSSGPSTLSSCATPPSAVKIDDSNAAVTPYSGACKADGTFRIEAPGNLGSYYLKVQTVLYETTKRTGIDLSLDRLGRNDISGVTAATLAFSMSGMQTWNTGDLIFAFAPNLGYRQNMSFTSGAPTMGATSLSGVASWSGYKLDSAKSDTLQIVQLGKHTTGGGINYVTLDRVFNVPAFTLNDNAQHPISGAFQVPPASNLTLTLNVGSFNAFSAQVAPSVTNRTIQGSLFAAVSTDAVESPALFSFAQSSEGINIMSFGTVPLGDPFANAWKRLLKIQVAYSVPYTWNSIAGSMNALVVRVLTKASAEAGSVVAELGPPTQIKFDNDDAMTDTAISPVPLVSWSPPSSGSATDYEVQVYEAKINGSALSFTPVLRMVTKSTSVRIPSGYLLGQRQYVFAVRARVRSDVDVHSTPLRAGSEWASADALTALVTTDS